MLYLIYSYPTVPFSVVRRHCQLLLSPSGIALPMPLVAFPSPILSQYLCAYKYHAFFNWRLPSFFQYNISLLIKTEAVQGFAFDTACFSKIENESDSFRGRQQNKSSRSHHLSLSLFRLKSARKFCPFHIPCCSRSST